MRSLMCVEAIEKGPGTASALIIHRLDKIDTAVGIKSVQEVAAKGVSYPVLLYERLLGRPFASHRDSVSSRVGEIVEDAVNVFPSGRPHSSVGSDRRWPSGGNQHVGSGRRGVGASRPDERLASDEATVPPDARLGDSVTG